MSKLFSSSNALKVLSFLSQCPAGQFLAVEIQKALKISKGGVSIALRELQKDKFIKRERKGNSYLYSSCHSEPVIRQFKILNCVHQLTPLVNRLKSISAKVVLFGSCARGEDGIESDVDLCLVTNSRDQAETALRKVRFPRTLQPIIRTPVQFMDMQKTDPVFWAEINKGVVLWEAGNESGI